jgi:hypothetical protein
MAPPVTSARLPATNTPGGASPVAPAWTDRVLNIMAIVQLRHDTEGPPTDADLPETSIVQAPAILRRGGGKLRGSTR